MHRSTDKTVFSQIQPITRTTLLNVHHNFCSLLSDVLNCTNMNTDFTDFRK